MKPSSTEQAARNNAIWCNTVCRAHGVEGELCDTVWVNRRPSPPYYPNLVTLRDVSDQTAAVDHIRHLIELPLQGTWSVKDSFCTLDLTALGFGLLFDASWMWHGPLPRQPTEQSSEIQWAAVTSPAELAMWEAAWSDGTGSTGMADKSRQFPASLLADRNIVILAGYRGQLLVAGGIANHTDGLVGLSNVFAPSSDEISVWAGLVTNAQAAFPRMPLIGYQQGHSLEAARASGFEVIGALRVWLRHG